MKRFYEKLIRKFMTSFETFLEQFHKTHYSDDDRKTFFVRYF